MNGEKRNSCRILVVTLQGTRAFGRPRRRWKDNVKTNLREIGWGGMDWIDMDHDGNRWKALVNMVMNLWVPEDVGKFLNSCAAGSFSRKTRLHELAIMKCKIFCCFVYVATDYCTILLRNSTARS
jgi:hypothetical protein